jgi:hypothetical protein
MVFKVSPQIGRDILVRPAQQVPRRSQLLGRIISAAYDARHRRYSSIVCFRTPHTASCLPAGTTFNQIGVSRLRVAL